MSSTDKRKCPECGNTFSMTEANSKSLPFCSPRCKTLDLGNWASEKYRISSAEGISNEESEEVDEE